jgi:hypothetical protein
MKFNAERPPSQWPAAAPQGELICDESMTRERGFRLAALSIAGRGVIHLA